MMFCPKCGSILMPKKDKDKRYLACSSCKYTDKGKEKKTITEKVVPEKEIQIVSEDEEKSLPVIEIDGCSKCGHKKAYYWLVQTRAGDEAETKFYKCTKCKHTWREYD